MHWTDTDYEGGNKLPSTRKSSIKSFKNRFFYLKRNSGAYHVTQWMYLPPNV